MNTVRTSGIVLGVFVVVWMFVMGFTGWYKQPALAGLFYFVIGIQVSVLIVALQRTARQGRRYLGQLAAGTAISAIAAVLIAGGSLLFTTVAFPTYFADVSAVQEQLMREGGTSEAEIQRLMQNFARNQKPWIHALSGAVGTLVTGFVTSVVVGAFVRAK